MPARWKCLSLFWKRSAFALGLCLLCVRFQCVARGEEDAEFFERKIRPLLTKHCYSCHSVDKKQEGGLVLDSKSGWADGGDNGPAIKPGDLDGSLVIKAVRWDDEALQMPPKDAGGKLTDAQIRDLETWVAQGAFDPRVATKAAPKRKPWAEAFAERKSWWSLEPVKDVPVPDVNDPAWSKTAIDQFLFAKMAAEGIAPAGLASPPTLIRRAALVLTGLPPTVDEVAAFVAACEHDREAAYVALIDRLLESPRFGERFARHWLDVVRFTETHGNEWNYDVPFAWRYRDYIIRAFHQDLPYDQFVREHVAGDLLASPRWNREGNHNESAIGTAFYRFGEVNHDSCVDFSIIGYDIIDNQLDTLTKTFQAATVACARCHDHKLDAISTKDYHALFGILRSTRPVQRTLDGSDVNREPIARLKSLKHEMRAELAQAWRQDATTIDAARLNALVEATKDKPPGVESPLHTWMKAVQADTPISERWKMLTAEFETEHASRTEFNQTQFTPLADFRETMPAGWTCDGMGLREGIGSSGDFVPAHEGEAAVKGLLPAGLFTFAVSDKLNGALRSPTLERKGSKVSFEVIGGRSSLARIVFNNCQLNYTHQQSLHYNDWTWVTIKYDEKTEPLHPYAEFLTYWDNPKFPDPLGTLGKDTENQRLPWSEHVKNPRTWWGVRRIVTHDGAEAPQPELSHLARLYSGEAPQTADDLVRRYQQIATNVIETFSENHATDDDVRWLNWLVNSGLFSNNMNATPKLADLSARYREMETHQLALPTVMPGMADEGPGFSQPVLLAGEPNRPSDLIDRRYLEALSPLDRVVSAGSGRLLIAEEMTRPDNPLTARVMVNRLWQWVFRDGLVRTPDDFGHLGELPSHPELLDHLATQFVRDGWSMKRVVRALVLSRAFQSSGVPTATARERDPDNRWLSHYPSRRAEAEVIRDELLAVSGRLDGKLYGPSVHPYREKADNDKRLYAGPLDGDGRRSLYIKFQLMEAPHFLRAFNLPGGKVTQGRRDASNVPAQSLAMLNDPFVLAMADFWAGRLVQDGNTLPAARIEQMFRTALGRGALEVERTRFEAAISQMAAVQNVPPGELMSSQPVWKEAAHAMFNFQEFIFIP